METKKRSIIKALTWRTCAFILLAIISYLVTGDIKEMTKITVIYQIIQIVLYFMHERLWDKVEWGRLKHPLAEIPVKKRLQPEDEEKIIEKLKELGYID